MTLLQKHCAEAWWSEHSPVVNDVQSFIQNVTASVPNSIVYKELNSLV